MTQMWNLEGFAVFWSQIEFAEALREKARLYYDLLCDYTGEEYDLLCDYTGEECWGNKMFCEECPVLTEE